VIDASLGSKETCVTDLTMPDDAPDNEQPDASGAAHAHDEAGPLEDDIPTQVANPEENETSEDDAAQEEPRDPLEEALERAEKAEKEIAYRDAEIQNVRKRLMAEKADAIQYGGMGLARRMLTVLGDVDRALSSIDDDDESPVAQGLRLLRNKMWRELEADGVVAIKAKGEPFDPSKMEAITTIPASEQFQAGHVVDELEAGYLYKSKVITVARVVVASD
jgi:molecular chaperone GrpE